MRGGTTRDRDLCILTPIPTLQISALWLRQSVGRLDGDDGSPGPDSGDPGGALAQVA